MVPADPGRGVGQSVRDLPNTCGKRFARRTNRRCRTGTPGNFFIFVSKEISASDYKRLVRHHVADWVSLQGAPEEIEEIISREGQTETTGSAPGAKPIIIAFVPSGGGVGNSTLALEAAVQLKQNKQSRDRRICLLDLDLQTSHVCDYLDIEPRLQMRDIVMTGPLDAQLRIIREPSLVRGGRDCLASQPPRSSRTEPGGT